MTAPTPELIRYWPGQRTLMTAPAGPKLDLDATVGQRQATFRFYLTDGVTGEQLGELHPIREPATLTHDTTSTIKRHLSVSLGKADVAAIDPLRDRVAPYMVFPGVGEFPLGRYMFTVPQTQLVAVAQRTGVFDLNDEMFLVDQQITAGIDGYGANINNTLVSILQPLPVRFEIGASPYASAQAWSIGTGRGQILEALAFTGDYWSPWFDNLGVLQFERSFDPATQVVDFDFDTGRQVYRDSIVETSELLTAPNVFIVVSNGGPESTSGPIVGIARVPASAPYSVANRGFEIPMQVDVQLYDASQAQAVAVNLAQRNTVFETVTVTTAPDPRHDSYDVIRWQGDNWLETAWAMEMAEGGQMQHTMRKSYAP